MKKVQSKEQAIETVKNGNLNDHIKIYGFAKEWVNTIFKPFTSENMKEAYYKLGNEPPNEPRVFGSVFNQLSKDGLIFHHGWENSKNKVCHSRPQRVWISRNFRLKQQSNATKEQSLKLEL